MTRRRSLLRIDDSISQRYQLFRGFGEGQPILLPLLNLWLHQAETAPLAKKIKTASHEVAVNRAFEGERVELVMQVEKAQHVLARPVCGGQFQPLSHLLPGVRDTRLQGETGFVEIPEIEFAPGQKRFNAQLRQFGLRRAEFIFVAKKAQAPAHSFPDVVVGFEDVLQGIAADDLTDL